MVLEFDLRRELVPVAPDFSARLHFNTIALRPQCRISLRLGEIEPLFAHPPGTWQGRIERLQVLGLFYFPLDHARAREALEGTTTAGGTVIPGCWDWVKSRIFHVETDGQADEFIQGALRTRVVSGLIQTMESAATDPPFGLPAPGNFAKIRFPGGYSFFLGGGLNPNEDSAYPFSLTINPRYLEDLFFTTNGALGKIPLVAKVERREGEDWVAAPGARVFFQLVPPDELEAPDDVSPAWLQYNHAPIEDDAIAERVREAESGEPDPSDPQSGNCSHFCGGERGRGTVGDAIFRLGATPGFPYEPVLEAATSDHPHAVATTTNEAGEAGVVFTPSHMGGDRYKIRAYAWSEADGAVAAEVTTGTFVVWRNVRVSRILRKDVDWGVWPDLIEEAAAGRSGEPIAEEGEYLFGIGVVDMNEDDWSYSVMMGLPQFDAPSFVRQFARAFVELEFDEGPDPKPIEEEDRRRAHALALEHGREGIPELGRELAPELLLRDPREAPGFPDDNTVALLLMRTPEAYNALVGEHDPRWIPMIGPDDDRRMDPSLFESFDYYINAFLIHGVFRGLSRGGFLPGLTVVQAPASCTWLILGLTSSAAETNLRWRGTGSQYRLCCVQYGLRMYEIEGVSEFPETVAHEVGHLLFREHAPGGDAGGAKEAEHDPVPPASANYCIMSYGSPRPCFCSKCLLALRGWDIESAAPLVDPYPTETP